MTFKTIAVWGKMFIFAADFRAEGRDVLDMVVLNWPKHSSDNM